MDNHSYASELVSKTLETIKNQYIQNIETYTTKYFIGTIDRANFSGNKISNILERSEYF